MAIQKRKRIDWSKERTVSSNFCGYCDNTPTGGSCDGGCFTRTDISSHAQTEYKRKHLKNELELLYEERILLAERKKLLDEELRLIGQL